MDIPAIIIAGPGSGCGKTTVSMGIMAALTHMGYKVQPYKVGPDFIDPMFHTRITGRESRNLDSWLLEEDTVRYLFQKNAKGADVAVIEGVMGLYDGYDGKSALGSTAHVSAVTGAPIVFVIDGSAMSRSAAALVKGFSEFDKTIDIIGVIINNTSKRSHYEMLKRCIEDHAGIPVLGCLPHSDAFALGSRHLGLITSAETAGLNEKIDILSKQTIETVDIVFLVKILQNRFGVKAGASDVSGSAGGSNHIAVSSRAAAEFMKGKACHDNVKARIAVAMDKAFCFYYRDNLDLLEALGAELVYFSPLEDARLPENIDGLYIGGGYPEIWGKELQDNISVRNDIKRQIEAGLPAYAECGGLMYMCESITDGDGNIFEMTGLLPGKSRMTDRLQRFGYVNVRLAEDTVLSPKGSEIRAHEFHYSETVFDFENEAYASGRIKTCFDITKSAGRSWTCGYKTQNLLAGYPHLHFWSNPQFAKGFVESCVIYRQKRRDI